ncbi:hypothetical protein BH09ACT6_BH09ACT6_05490 [soil metagenome]
MRDLAGRINVSAGTISAVEAGQTRMTIDRLAVIADAFGMSVSELLRNDDAKRMSMPPANTHWRVFAQLDVDRVLSAAIVSFVETGYHGATMRDIAQRAGMSTPGVYHHYNSKQELLVRILDLAMDDLEWRLESARSANDHPLERLSALVEALALFHTLRPELAIIGASEMRSLSEPEHRRIADRRSGVQRLIDAEIESAVHSGSASVSMPHEVGYAITTMCTALPQWFDPHGQTSAYELAIEYGRLACRMIGARESAPV